MKRDTWANERDSFVELQVDVDGNGFVTRIELST